MGATGRWWRAWGLALLTMLATAAPASAMHDELPVRVQETRTGAGWMAHRVTLPEEGNVSFGIRAWYYSPEAVVRVDVYDDAGARLASAEVFAWKTGATARTAFHGDERNVGTAGLGYSGTGALDAPDGCLVTGRTALGGSPAEALVGVWLRGPAACFGTGSVRVLVYAAGDISQRTLQVGADDAVRSLASLHGEGAVLALPGARGDSAEVAVRVTQTALNVGMGERIDLVVHDSWFGSFGLDPRSAMRGAHATRDGGEPTACPCSFAGSPSGHYAFVMGAGMTRGHVYLSGVDARLPA